MGPLQARGPEGTGSEQRAPLANSSVGLSPAPGRGGADSPTPLKACGVLPRHLWEPQGPAGGVGWRGCPTSAGVTVKT